LKYCLIIIILSKTMGRIAVYFHAAEYILVISFYLQYLDLKICSRCKIDKNILFLPFHKKGQGKETKKIFPAVC